MFSIECSYFTVIYYKTYSVYISVVIWTFNLLPSLKNSRYSLVSPFYYSYLMFIHGLFEDFLFFCTAVWHRGSVNRYISTFVGRRKLKSRRSLTNVNWTKIPDPITIGHLAPTDGPFWGMVALQTVRSSTSTSVNVVKYSLFSYFLKVRVSK